VTGPRLTLTIGAAVAAMCAALLATYGFTLAGTGAVIRWTARTSLVLFAIAYIARPATQLWPSPLTKGLLARRTWIGLGYALSHLFHLAGIVAVARADWDAFVAGMNVATYVGGVGFVVLAAMAFTSARAIERRMPKRAWTALHRTGMHLFWLIFVATYAGRIGAAPAAAVPTAALVALAAVRCAAFVRTRRRAAARVAVAA
jgi:DMSO/TMAO reductase YedYZ heme-binding membrane subunit